MATHEIDGKWWTRAASLGLRPRLPIRSPHLARARFGCFERLDCAEPVGREAGCGRRFNGGRCVVAARCLKALAERENSFGNVHMQAPLIRPHSEPSPFARCQNAFERCILERSEASACSYNHLVRAQFGRCALCVWSILVTQFQKRKGHAVFVHHQWRQDFSAAFCSIRRACARTRSARAG